MKSEILLQKETLINPLFDNGVWRLAPFPKRGKNLSSFSKRSECPEGKEVKFPTLEF